ncbi:exodeoxyribonuclease V subunit beta [Enterobacteriaceae endosymbiont of Donacia tomentosa]|uniref:exodeoxyribonuclease V subunit beta n=1 Tax=Enterobacteriaceae endosymbiont of Donacia tomentosa TaxID=2675787 RepID=UPI0014492475|nr:exodeoxyribonuclease V subunit beta [Enterobacteriaceae endosymbiont of Donacia tomentosa]QJC31829.1 exodeoxyribonuclease V subunit beta [Enterobacteriaceae endosymbiont of Donacia tomentosa]
MIKKIIKFKEFDPFKENIQGSYLIEASAGTGKTFTIIIIYLRLLLGLYQQNNSSLPLNIEQILVVTFTDLATQSLCQRIKKSIKILRIACIKGKSKYSTINNLIKEIKNLKEANELLLRAELNFNNASICTIHSFCQKILNFKNYEIYDFNPQEKIISNEYHLQYKIIINFWRKYFYNLPKNIIKIIFLYWKSPTYFLNKLLPFLSKYPSPLLKNNIQNINLSKQFNNNINYINNIKKNWIKYKENIINVISNSTINKYIYNKRSINNWINIIDKWSIEKTEDNFYPEQLFRFSQKELTSKTINKKKIPKFILFNKIDLFLDKIINIKALIILKAIKYINKHLRIEKQKNKEISFDDLLILLHKILKSSSGSKIAKDIRTIFPVILIDEFQDTNIQQYDIFKKIYINHSNNIIILIGDPKQAIYSFRGADIFTYIKASFEIKNCYTLKNNWRSSKTMVSSVNQLFSNRSYPFIFENINFYPILYTSQKANYNFIINNKIKSGITFWFLDKEETNINSYKQKMAYTCAQNICQLLHLGIRKKSILQKNNSINSVNITDITILVRNRYEAILLQKEFIKFNLPSIYLSNPNNIFEMIEAKELVLLLKAILQPDKEQKIINILGSKLFSINLSNFDHDKKAIFMKQVNREFSKYQLIWKKNGILKMLEEIFLKNSIFFQKQKMNSFNKEKIKNILYIGEIIQTLCIHITDKHKIIEWLLKQITYPNVNITPNLKIKFDNSINKIKIMTIHKSKGLQFPIVWLPFISCNFVDLINLDGIIYHDRKNLKTIIDFDKNKKSIKYSFEECLSENLRLLYVSLTRSIFHCSIGISNIKIHNIKKYILYYPYYNALDFLIRKKYGISTLDFKKILNNFKSTDISIKIIKLQKLIKLNIQLEKETKNEYVSQIKSNFIKYNNSVITSFSQIKKQQHNNFSYNDIYKFLFVYDKNIKKTQYNFPIGKNIGIMIHNILEKLDFTKPILKSFIKKELIKNNISSHWHIVVTNWFNNILTHSLGTEKIILNKINIENRKTEFEFYLSIKKILSITKLNKIIFKYDNISHNLPKLTFEKIKGFLTGVIDLIFCWKNKYFIIDYKSNWLGFNNKSYKKKYIEQNICQNRYDIQYQFYVLALHKYLKFRIKDYNYETHFGKILYLYIRGIDKIKNNQNGIWETRPSIKLISKLDKLLS